MEEDKRTILMKLIDSKKYFACGLGVAVVGYADQIFSLNVRDDIQLIVMGALVAIAMIMNGIEDAAEKGSPSSGS